MGYTSEVGICNLSLSWLGGNRITSLDDDTDEANLCVDNYEFSRDTVLEMRNWTFATSRVKLNPLVEAPEFGFKFKCVLPPECIRVIQASTDPDFRYGIEWVREENLLLSNYPDPYIRFIKRMTDVTRFSPLFVKAMAAQLAADMAIPLTASKKLMDAMMARMDYFLEQAGGMDGTQGRNQKLRATRLTGVR
ncbi:MAG: hypothetical protein KAS32_29065 [Candidatus Peribacteraceae bacterium]|nr:hypothetical protein [Candidatus Peribacteraceae bacterium]